MSEQMSRTTIQLSSDLLKEARLVALQKGLSLAAYIRQLIIQDMEKREVK